MNLVHRQFDVHLPAVTNENARNPMVLSALTLLYACNVLGFVKQWDEIFINVVGTDSSTGIGLSFIAKQLLVEMGLVLADALLVSYLSSEYNIC